MRIRKIAAVGVLGTGLLAALLPLTSAQAAGAPYGVALYENGTKLGRFSTANPGAMTPIGSTITGLEPGDDFLVGIDRRVQNGRLYGVGDGGGIYLMAGNRATQVGQLSVALQGSSVGVDFNPAANALRVVSNTGQNLRQPFGDGDATSAPTVVDTPLSYPAVTPAATATGINGAAYTNNDLSADTATTLFDIDSNLDQVAVQSPANAGSLAPTGKLGVGAGVSVGFDIYSELGSGGATVSNQAFAAIPAGTNYRLHRIDLLTGDATYVGKFRVRVTDIALDIDR